MTDEARTRCEAADAARTALARGGVSGLVAFVIDLWVERDRYRRIAGFDRDTEPCGAPDDGGL